MTHLTMDQLLALREPGVEPGTNGARLHLEDCPVCQAESDRLHQRVARLRALPTLRPPRSRLPDIQRTLRQERRQRFVRWGALGGLAAAAALAAVLLVPRTAGPEGGAGSDLPTLDPEAELQLAKLRSQELEAALGDLNFDARSLDGRTATMAARLEDQLGLLDHRIQVTGQLATPAPQRMSEELKLWRERVGLLGALMDVHLTRARYAGL